MLISRDRLILGELSRGSGRGGSKFGGWILCSGGEGGVLTLLVVGRLLL